MRKNFFWQTKEKKPRKEAVSKTAKFNREWIKL